MAQYPQPNHLKGFIIIYLPIESITNKPSLRPLNINLTNTQKILCKYQKVLTILMIKILCIKLTYYTLIKPIINKEKILFDFHRKLTHPLTPWWWWLQEMGWLFYMTVCEDFIFVKHSWNLVLVILTCIGLPSFQRFQLILVSESSTLYMISMPQQIISSF